MLPAPPWGLSDTDVPSAASGSRFAWPRCSAVCSLPPGLALWLLWWLPWPCRTVEFVTFSRPRAGCRCQTGWMGASETAPHCLYLHAGLPCRCTALL